MLLLTAACVSVVLAAVALRISAGWPEHLATRLSAIGVAALLPLGLLAWLPSGPLGAGWAARAGTPPSLLARVHAATRPATSSHVRSTAGAGTTSFIAAVGGRIRQVQVASGLMLIDMPLTVHGQRLSNLHIRIRGEPINGGGVQMTTSRVTLGPSSNPDQYIGQVTGLQGTEIAAHVSDGAGSSLSLIAGLQISPGPGAVSGTVRVSPAGSP
jgi:hypothetical protein